MERRIKRGWMNLEVSKIVQETHDCVTLHLVNQEEKTRAFDYTAGQYLTFRFDDLADRPLVRSYTMSSSPKQPEHIAVTVKEVENGFISRYLCKDVKVGQILRARGPIGKFCFDPITDQKNLVMVAAGSGVTPFVSILREYASELGNPDAPSSMTLLVSYRTQQDLICWPELCEANQIPGVRVITTLSRQSAPNEGFFEGRISTKLIDLALDGEPSDKTFMTCGPEEMMNMTCSHLVSKGVLAKDIKTESFFS